MKTTTPLTRPQLMEWLAQTATKPTLEGHNAAVLLARIHAGMALQGGKAL